MSSGKWSLTVAALLGATIGMAVSAWPDLSAGTPLDFREMLVTAGIGAAILAILAFVRNAFVQ